MKNTAATGTMNVPFPRANDGLGAGDGVNLGMGASRSPSDTGGNLKLPGHGPSPDHQGGVKPSDGKRSI